jgi:DNA mismatch repair protein MutS2
VAVRGKRLQCRPEELTAVAGAAPRRGAGVSWQAAADAEAAPPAELMLIGERVEPALARLDEYLDRALLASRPEVRVVHGHGSGRLRDAVRAHLRGHPAVGHQRPGAEGEGGDGATVVTLRGGE